VEVIISASGDKVVGLFGAKRCYYFQLNMAKLTASEATERYGLVRIERVMILQLCTTVLFLSDRNTTLCFATLTRRRFINGAGARVLIANKGAFVQTKKFVAFYNVVIVK
jgi:hypothetical protein